MDLDTTDSGFLKPTKKEGEADRLPISTGAKSLATSSRKIRAELNLEHWPQIFAPAHSKIKETRTYSRTWTLADGSVHTSLVEVSYVDRLGTLTTEDHKTYAALLKLWEDSGRPTGKMIPYSRRHLAKILDVEPNDRSLARLRGSLRRLRGVPIFWRDSFFNKETGEYLTIEEPFNILSNLMIVERKNGSKQLVLELGGYKLDDRITTNILHNHSRPLYLDVLTSIRGEIAQLLYRHLENMLAPKRADGQSINPTLYKRRTAELFADLDIRGNYKYRSKRAQILKPAITELKGKRISSGTLKALRLEPTADDRDFNLIVEKETDRELLKKHPNTRRRYLDADSSEVLASVLELIEFTNDEAHRPIFTMIARLYGSQVIYRAISETREQVYLKNTNSDLPRIKNLAAYVVAVAQRLGKE